MTQTANKAIIIARVSTEEQATAEHFRIPAQLKNLRQYAEKNNLGVLKEFVLSESSSSGERKEFSKAIQLVRNAEEPIAILVDKVDRFQRSFKEYILADELREAGKLELHFVSQGLTLRKNSAASDLMLWDMMVTMAKGYVFQLSDNVRRSIKFKVENGQFPSYAPIGYLNKENEIVLDPVRAPLIKEAFSQYATGDFSVEDLARKMSAKGLTTKGKKNESRPVGKSDLMYILKNVFYTGRFMWTDFDTGDHRVYDGNHEALIDQELFNRVQKILNDRNIRTKNGHSTAQFFKYRGLLRCGYCGSGMTPQDLSGGFKGEKNVSGIYYRCNYSPKYRCPDFYEKKFGKNHSGVINWKGEIRVNCPQRQWQEEEIDFMIEEYLETLTFDEEVYQNIREKLEQEWEERQSVTELQKKSIELELRKAETLKKGLVRALALEEFADDIQEELRQTKATIERLEGEKKALEEAEQYDTTELIEMLNICRNLHKQFNKLSSMNQRRLTMTAFKSIELKKGWFKKGREKMADNKSHLEYSEPFQELFDRWLKKNVKNESIIKSKVREG